MTQKQIESVAEAPMENDSVAEATQQMEGKAAVKDKPCSRCSSCLKCKLASGKRTVHSGGEDAHARPLA